MRTRKIAIVLHLRELEEYVDAFRTHGELLLRATLAAGATVDGDIDLADFAAFQAYYSGPGVPHGSGCGIFDADLDGDVDGHDLRVFLVLLDGRADFDHDLDIDADDWALLAECLGGLGVPLSADATGDGWVDAADFQLWAACSTAPDVPVGGPCAWSDLDGDADLADCARLTLQVGLRLAPACRPGDLDGDRDVDLADAGLFQAVFTGPRGGAPTAVNPFFFSGQRVDALDPIDPDDRPATPANARLVLYDYKARVYDPRHGRFQQRDPAEFADTYNLYEYAASRVTVLTDPTGEFSLGELSISSFISRGLTALNAAQNAKTALDAARALAAGATIQSVFVSLAIEYAADRFGGKLFDRITDALGLLKSKFLTGTFRGRLGGPAHRATVETIQKSFDDKVWNVVAEGHFKGTGGAGSRFADLVEFNKSTGELQIIQVGNVTNELGVPVSREINALLDILGENTQLSSKLLGLLGIEGAGDITSVTIRFVEKVRP